MIMHRFGRSDLRPAFGRIWARWVSKQHAVNINSRDSAAPIDPNTAQPTTNAACCLFPMATQEELLARLQGCRAEIVETAKFDKQQGQKGKKKVRARPIPHPAVRHIVPKTQMWSTAGSTIAPSAVAHAALLPARAVHGLHSCVHGCGWARLAGHQAVQAVPRVSDGSNQGWCSAPQDGVLPA